MKYEKPALSYDEQAKMLLSRGMAGDLAQIKACLEAASYYRLSGYWYSFRDIPGDKFKAGSRFEDVWMRYTFDRRFRVIVMDAIERVEIAIRAWLAYEQAHAHGPFGYAVDVKSLNGIKGVDRARLLEELSQEMRYSKESFAIHFREKYHDSHDHMPIWMACETMTFGQLLKLYRGSSNSIKNAVSERLKVHHSVLLSWMLCLNTVRNICAHHGRLWNRGLGVKPKIPRMQMQWQSPVAVHNDQMFCVLTILKYSLDRIAPQSKWPGRVVALFGEFNTVPLKFMGFPDNWEQCPIWKQK